MEIRDSISITGKRMAISSLISESFVYKASDLSSHGVSVDMTDEGVVTVKIDGQTNSSYKKEIVDSHILDEYIERLYLRLISGYEKLAVFYLKMYAKNSKVRFEQDLDNLINSLELKKYTVSPFELKTPDISEIESDLRVEAEGEDIIDESEIEKYIASHIEDSYNYRLMKWERIKKYHDEVQKVVERVVNEKYQKQYDDRKRFLQEVKAGESLYIKKRMKALESAIDLPFSTDIDYVYYPETGQIDIDFESPTTISIPQKKICMTDSGKQEIVRTSPKENNINQTKCKLSAIFYIAGSIWNITPKIKRINITNWQIKGQVGRCWFSFERDSFSTLDFQNLNIIEICEKVKHVFDIKDYLLQPMRLNIFKYAINEGHYDDNTLIKFVSRIKTIESKSYKKADIEVPKVEEGNSTPSINDMDSGYDLSKKPYIDKSFANWCYKLIEYEKCSLKLFLTDFGFSIDRAKLFMNQLLYLHFVGEKNSEGQRKVLIQTEAQLEYKLSWIFPNESWKY